MGIYPIFNFGVMDKGEVFVRNSSFYRSDLIKILYKLYLIYSVLRYDYLQLGID